IDAEEMALEIRHAEQILRYLPDAVTLACALCDFEFQRLGELEQRLFGIVTVGGFDRGDQNTADAVGSAGVRNRAVADGEMRFFEARAVALNLPGLIFGEVCVAAALQDGLVERAKLIVNFRPNIPHRLPQGAR